MTIDSADQWNKLPELVCPIIANQAAAGATHIIHKIGFLSVPKATGTDANIAGYPSEDGNHLYYPTAEIESEGQRRLFRLPLPLSRWALDAVELAQRRLLAFPTKVEFGVLSGRHYAQM